MTSKDGGEGVCWGNIGHFLGTFEYVGVCLVMFWYILVYWGMLGILEYVGVMFGYCLGMLGYIEVLC